MLGDLVPRFLLSNLKIVFLTTCRSYISLGSSEIRKPSPRETFRYLLGNH